MEYRDQLKYIKSHQDERRPGNDRRGKKKRGQNHNHNRNYKHKQNRRRPSGALDRLLWFVQAAATLFFLISMAVLNILPRAYMIGVCILLLLLLLFVKSLQRRAERSRKKRSSGKGLSVIASLLLIVIGFYGLKVNLALDQIAIGDESGGYAKQHMVPVTSSPFNVYISGIDVYGDIDQESRSDVNLIATINPNTHKILLTTTPRDYYVKIPGVSGDERDKLTHAGNYGVDVSMATLEELYDTKIPFYMRVNFTSVEEIVDVMGGIEVESELAFTTSKAAGEVVEVKEGMNHFNGKQALAFVRERKALASGDNQRGKNQQILLSALIKKACSPMILFHANKMIGSVAGNADTNLSEAQIKSLVRMQIERMEGWEIESVAAEGDDSGKKYCYSYKGGPLYVSIPDEDSVETIQKKIKETLRD